MTQIEQVQINDLIPYQNNPRVNDHAVSRVAKAISEFGFKVPILAKPDNTIVDGHLRYKAALKLSLRHVPVIYVGDLSEAQIKAFRLSVNKMAELADWDIEALKEELLSLEELKLSGFDAEELAKLLKDKPESVQIGEDQSSELVEVYEVVITVDSEQDQLKLIDRLSEEGYKCRAIIF